MKQIHHVDILAIGPHPDDIEVGCGGLLYQESQQGKSIVMVDCTPSQYSTRGTPEQRISESQHAAQIIGAQTRINLNFHDLMLSDNEEYRLAIAKLIRQYRPRALLLPDPEDRHPDHRILRDIVRGAFFIAGLASIHLDSLEPYRPHIMLLYPIRAESTPDIIIPISAEAFDKKMEAVRAYQSQYDTNSHCFEYLKARAVNHGFRIKHEYGEGLRVMDATLAIASLDHISSGLW